MFLWTLHQYLICHMFSGFLLCLSELSSSIWTITCFLVSYHVSLNCPPVYCQYCFHAISKPLNEPPTLQSISLLYCPVSTSLCTGTIYQIFWVCLYGYVPLLALYKHAVCTLKSCRMARPCRASPTPFYSFIATPPPPPKYDPPGLGPAQGTVSDMGSGLANNSSLCCTKCALQRKGYRFRLKVVVTREWKTLN